MELGGSTTNSVIRPTFFRKLFQRETPFGIDCAKLHEYFPGRGAPMVQCLVSRKAPTPFVRRKKIR
jgi:hypothetical protein